MADTRELRNIADEEWELRRKLAVACRVLGMQGHIGLYGHVSIRVPDSDIVLMTPGAGSEKTAVRIDQIFVFHLGGDIMYHPGGDKPMQIPAEWRIHTQIHRDRPEIGCVAHLHAHASTLLGIVGRDIIPVFAQGTVVADGVPTWDDPRMILNNEDAVSLSQTLGNHTMCQMRGHGSVVVGETVETTLAACIFAEENAQFQVEAEPFGGPKQFPSETWDRLVASRRGGGGARLSWDYWERKVIEQGLPL